MWRLLLLVEHRTRHDEKIISFFPSFCIPIYSSDCINVGPAGWTALPSLRNVDVDAVIEPKVN